jgi:UDP-N-acetyl-D-mannosaminuronate dehydrogenase
MGQRMGKIKVGFIGLGKLGLDCAEVFAEHYEVRGYDPAPRISELNKSL